MNNKKTRYKSKSCTKLSKYIISKLKECGKKRYDLSFAININDDKLSKILHGFRPIEDKSKLLKDISNYFVHDLGFEVSSISDLNDLFNIVKEKAPICKIDCINYKLARRQITNLMEAFNSNNDKSFDKSYNSLKTTLEAIQTDFYLKISS